jgi:hypothetical protein
MYYYPQITLDCPVWLKFSVTDLHIMMLYTCKSIEIRGWEGRNILVVVNVITFICVPRNCMASSKKHPLSYEADHFQSSCLKETHLLL